MKFAALIVLSMLFADGAVAQYPFARLSPDTLTANAMFGKTVGVSGENVFALTTPNRSSYAGGTVINVFERRNHEWPLTQTLIAPDSPRGPGYDHFLVAGDFLAARSSRVFLYRRDGTTWNMVDSTESPSGKYGNITFLDEEYMVLTYPTNSDGNDARRNVVFARNGDGWEDIGTLPEWSARTCIADGDAIQRIRVTVGEVVPGTEKLSSELVDALVISEHREAAWAVVDTVYSRAGDIDELECSGKSVAFTGDGGIRQNYAITFAGRGTDGKWSIDGEIDITEYRAGMLSVEFSKDHLYFGREYRDPDAENATISEVRMYARRLGEWKFVQIIKHPDRLDSTWEYNDGCIGYDIAAAGDYIVASAPIRGRRVGTEEYYHVGEAFIYVLGALDRWTPPAPEHPRSPYDLGRSNVYPNPGRGATTVVYRLPSEAIVRAAIFDAAGRRVATLNPGVRGAGSHELVFDTRDWAPGVYFLRMTVNHGVPATGTIVVTR